MLVRCQSSQTTTSITSSAFSSLTSEIAGAWWVGAVGMSFKPVHEVEDVSSAIFAPAKKIEDIGEVR